MKEIKAYIRRERINKLVEKLQEAGAPGITIVEVHPMSEHPDKMMTHMDIMMKDADHRRAMVEMLRRNPGMREEMKAIISDAEKPAASPTAK